MNQLGGACHHLVAMVDLLGSGGPVRVLRWRLLVIKVLLSHTQKTNIHKKRLWNARETVSGSE